jgi:SAM-dependent methyltransferase
MKPETAKKLLKLNYDLYEDQALAWDKTRSEIWEKTVTDFISKIKPNSSILDLGCGNGRLYKQLSVVSFQLSDQKSEIKYTGIDPSKKLIEINKEKYPDAKFEVGDGLTLKDKNKYDYVFCLAVLHHIPSEKLQIKFLKNIHQALRPKGEALISVWNRWQPRYKKYFNEKYKKEIQYKFSPVPHWFSDLKSNETIVPWKQSGKFRFVHAFTDKELKDLAQKAGFTNIEVFYGDASQNQSEALVKGNANKINKSDKNNGLNVYLIASK